MRCRTPEQLAAWNQSVSAFRAWQTDEELGYHRAALARWTPPEWPPCASDAERDDVHELLAKLSTERAARAAAHRQRLVSAARHLGREVRKHLVTMPDAERRLAALASLLDENSPPIALVPYHQAVALLRDAFAEGCRRAHH
jgi:hypothetical protein